MTKYGCIALENDQWVITQLAPQVAIRLKQIFPRIPKWERDRFALPNTPLNCADLSWFTSRYPLEIAFNDHVTLEGGRSQFEGNQADMEAILKPDYKPSQHHGFRQGKALRKYQGQAVDLTLLRQSLLLGDDAGLGKTIVAAGLFLAPGTLPAAVVMETHLQDQWQERIEEFTHLRVHRIKGTRPYDLPEADVYLFKYSQLLGWIDTFGDGFYKAVVFDEIQLLRTGTSSGKGQAAMALAEAAQYRLGLSATPIYNYGAEIWSIMRFIDPTVLGSHGDFMREWCPDGREVNDPDALGAFLREQQVFLRRTRAEVGRELPPVNTITEYVNADSKTLASIHDLASQLAIKTRSGSFMERGRAGRELDLLMRHATGVSKARSVAQYARILLENDEPIVIAAWHRDVYDILLEELAEFAPAMYTGSESPKQKAESKRRFLAGETNVFIMSLRSGAGLDGLETRCSTVLFAELDWSPKVHDQVIWRVDRGDQAHPVTAIYLLVDEGSDPPITEVLGVKSSQSHGIVNPGQQLKAKHTDRSRIQALAAQYLEKKRKAA